MIYLTWYLIIGAVTLLAVMVSHRHSHKIDSDSRHKPPGCAQPYRILDDLTVPVLGGMFMIAAWPVALVMKCYTLFSKKIDVTLIEERKFAVIQHDLLQKVSVEEIEQRERIVDPMGAVPDLPFGHLHTAWSKFSDGLEAQDVIWTFSAHWITAWGRKELRAGYVVVSANAIGPHFLTSCKTLDED